MEQLQFNVADKSHILVMNRYHRHICYRQHMPPWSYSFDTVYRLFCGAVPGLQHHEIFPIVSSPPPSVSSPPPVVSSPPPTVSNPRPVVSNPISSIIKHALLLKSTYRSIDRLGSSRYNIDLYVY